MGGDRGPAATDGAACSCKVGRVGRKYDLADLDAELRRRHVDGASLRELETVVNQAVLRSALRTAGVDLVGDVDAVYRALVDDDVSAGARTETRDRLARAGVDVDALVEDFASYQTVRTHLRECLGVETSRSAGTSVEDARATVEWARSRSGAITERTLERLRDAGELATGELELTHVVRATCADCGATYTTADLLERGSCECEGGSG